MKFKYLFAKILWLLVGTEPTEADGRAALWYDVDDEAFKGKKPDGTVVNLETGEVATTTIHGDGIISFTVDGDTDEEYSNVKLVGKQVGLMFVDGAFYDPEEYLEAKDDESDTIEFNPPLTEGSKVKLLLTTPS